jgi:plastocyanin
MASKNLILAIVVVAIIAAGFIFLKGSNKAVTPSTSEVTSEATPSPSASESAAMEQEMSATTVNITANGFTPKTVTIKVGESVTWMNNDTAPHNVNSDTHPSHTVYPPLNLETIQPGASKSLSFPKAGTYKYHDHLNPQLQGTVVVQ